MTDVHDRPEEPTPGARRLREAVARLPAESEPARDLWPGIRARIDAGRVAALPGAAHSPRLRWTRLAAAAVLLVTATATTTWYVMRDGRPVVTGAPAPAVPSDAAAALASFASYEASVATLTGALERRSGTLDPRTRAILERSLRTIDGAIAEAREALATDPSSPAVRAFVVAAYRQKIDFLQRANDVAALQGS